MPAHAAGGFLLLMLVEWFGRAVAVVGLLYLILLVARCFAGSERSRHRRTLGLAGLGGLIATSGPFFVVLWLLGLGEFFDNVVISAGRRLFDPVTAMLDPVTGAVLLSWLPSFLFGFLVTGLVILPMVTRLRRAPGRPADSSRDEGAHGAR